MITKLSLMPSIKSNSRSNDSASRTLHSRTGSIRIFATGYRMKAARRNFASKRCFSLSAAVSFLFFLTLSGPHRVHHFFEQPPSIATKQVAAVHVHDHYGGHGHHPERPPASSQTDCAVLAVAQSAHVLLVSSFDLPALGLPVAREFDRPIKSTFSFSPSPRSQRAPPLI